MSFETVVDELKQIHSHVGASNDGGDAARHQLTKEGIVRWAKLLRVPQMTICERIAEYIARGFHARELEYDYCDRIANHLWGFMIDQMATGEDEWSPFVYEVYDAFDQGEWPHVERLDEDPAEVHSRPLIADIVARLDSGHSR